jgi:PST family polysaccharide transporter
LTALRPAGVSVARNAALLSVGTVAARLAMFAFAVGLGRGLGIEAYGLYGYAFALGLVLMPVADAGITQYLVREAARDRDRAERLLGPLLRVKLALSAVVVAAVAAAALALGGDRTAAAVTALLVVAAMADGVAQLAFAYFQGRERMGLEATATAAAAVARSAGGLAVVALTGELVAVVLWLLAVSLAQVAYVGARLRASLSPRDESPPRAAVDWRVMLGMGSIVALTMVYTRADTVLIGWILDARAVGLYTAAYTIMLGAQIVPWMIGTAVAPIFARAHGREPAVFEAAWQRGLRAMTLVALPLSLSICLLSAPILERLFGPQFAPAATALAILIWSGPLAAFNFLVGRAFRGAGRERLLIRTSAAGVVVNVGLNLWAIGAFGIEGAAAVTVATEVMIATGMGWLAVAGGVVAAPRLPLSRLAFAGGALALVAAALSEAAVELALTGALAAFGAVAVATRLVTPRDVALLRPGARGR